jgi:Uma2 family endonuclease
MVGKWWKCSDWDVKPLALPDGACSLAVVAKPMVSQLTYADIEALPYDGKRYELIDGELFVSASPSTAHQDAVINLLLLLLAACPPHLKVMVGPFDWLVDQRNVYVPDLIVARRRDFTARNLPRPPVLAVEVLSPSTRKIDVDRKYTAYERAGLAHYWMVDPFVPAVRVVERRDGRFCTTAAVTGADTLALERPFPVTLVPDALLAG